MRRLLPLLAAVALIGCGGNDSPEAKLKDDVKEKTEQVRERVEQAGKKASSVDQALLEIEQMDLPDDVKQQLLEAKELLDKYEDE